MQEKNISAWPAATNSNQQTITDHLGQTVNQLNTEARDAYDDTQTGVLNRQQFHEGKVDSK